MSTDYRSARRREPVTIHYPEGPSHAERIRIANELIPLRVPQLIAELCRVHLASEHALPNTRHFPLHEQMFTLLIRHWRNQSYHMVADELRKHAGTDVLRRVPHRNTLINVQHSTQLTVLLRKALRTTVVPIRNLECAIAIDGTGIATSKVANWIDSDKGRRPTRPENQWLRAVAAVGCATNMVTALETSKTRGIGSAEVNWFEPLLRSSASLLDLRYVLGDKAFLSDEHCGLAGTLGIQPIIPIKANMSEDTFKSIEGRELFDLYTYHIDRFHEIFRYRSKIESVFSAIKRLMGDHVRTRACAMEAAALEDSIRIGAGRENELLAKFVVYNLRRLIFLETFHEQRVNFATGRAFNPLPAEWFSGPTLRRVA